MASWFCVFSMDALNCAMVLVRSLARWSRILFCVSRSEMWVLRLVIWSRVAASEVRVSSSVAVAAARLPGLLFGQCKLLPARRQIIGQVDIGHPEVVQLNGGPDQLVG